MRHRIDPCDDILSPEYRHNAMSPRGINRDPTAMWLRRTPQRPSLNLAVSSLFRDSCRAMRNSMRHCRSPRRDGAVDTHVTVGRSLRIGEGSAMREKAMTTGSLYFYTETGTEGGYWAFVKEDTHDYEGMSSRTLRAPSQTLHQTTQSCGQPPRITRHHSVR
jgi:hypothetical protein